jgi:copper chaperone CopZ
MNVRRVTLEIHGLGCGGGGVLSVERALSHVNGVRRAYVNPATEMAYVEYDPDVVDSLTLVRTIEKTGLSVQAPIAR